MFWWQPSEWTDTKSNNERVIVRDEDGGAILKRLLDYFENAYPSREAGDITH